MEHLKKTYDINEQIKLVIWDLDETFWKGTLSEEEILPLKENIDILKKLVDRGIINSISSKNDLEQAKEKLQELGVWDYFIFPKINWNPKGVQIKNLISQAQLRDNNVLFIDDNHLNLKEAVFSNPNIKTAFPDIISQLLTLPALKGKDDASHSKLKQYKILEAKEKEKENFESNFDFLIDSNISVKTTELLEEDCKRVLEMIEKTNQLNFTKKRINHETLLNIINDNTLTNRCVYVNDKYGDYGLVGFLSYNSAKHELEHFLFSCRILNLGVEQWVYSEFNFPNLTIAEPVAAKLDKTKPNWINLDKAGNKENKKNFNKNITLLITGHCDASPLAQYISFSGLNILENYPVNSAENRVDSISNMKHEKELDNETKEKIYSKHPNIKRETHNNKVFTEKYDILVFALGHDYSSFLYDDKELNLTFSESIVISFKIAEKTDAKEIFDEIKKRKLKGYSEEVINRILDTSENIRSMTEEDLINNLNFLTKHVKTPIVFINTPEVRHPNDAEFRYSLFQKLNKVLDEFIANNKNCYLLDTRNFVKSINETTDSCTHYKRNIYSLLSGELLNIVNQVYDGSIKISTWKFFAVKSKLFFKNIVSYIKTVRKFLIQIKFKKDKKIVRLLGLYFLNKENIIT